LAHYQGLAERIEDIITINRRYEMLNINENVVQEKILPDLIFGGYRFKGRYHEIGKVFKIVAKAAGRHISGAAMTLYHDSEYKEENADIEGGFPLNKSLDAQNINCRILPGGRAVVLIHRGPYEDLGRSYNKIYSYVEGHDLKVRYPGREVYLKGPGMIFRGNPERYVTEIQLLVE